MARNEVEVGLMWLRDRAGLRLVWKLQIEPKEGHRYFDINVDAGAQLPDDDPDRGVTRFDLVMSDSWAVGSGGERQRTGIR